MSIHTIPDRFLNTTLNIFRNSITKDAVGDSIISPTLAYASLKTNLQPKKTKGADNGDTSFEINGVVHIQTHIAFLNRVENSVFRNINIADIAQDEKSGLRYMILAVREWQSANPNISDSHHITLILKSVSGVPKNKSNVKSLNVKSTII